MAAPKTEGPTFFTWLLGRVAHPPRANVCPRCKSATVVPAPSEKSSTVCTACRREALLASLSR